MADPERAQDVAGDAPAANDAYQFAVDVARIAAAHKTEEIAVLDLRGLSSLTDFFVVGTGTSDRQMHAVFNRIAEHARSVGRRAFKVAETRQATWFLADYVDVVVHLFDSRHRQYYDLDSLWGDAPRVGWGGEESSGDRQSAE